MVQQRHRLDARIFKLDNGIVTVVSEDHSVPLVAVSITYKVGSLDEDRGRAGFAHLFEHLMFQGTQNMLPNEISRLVESHGGVDNAYTMKTNTTYHEVVPAHALEPVLWAEADRMRGLVISERELAVEKQVVIEELRQSYLNQPYRLATDRDIAELAFKRWESSHPTIGSIEDIRNAELKDVHDFYRRFYSPNNAVLALAGAITFSQAKTLVRRHFGSIKRGPSLKRPNISEPALRGTRERVVSDPLAKTPMTVIGWHTPPRLNRDWWAMTLLMTILSSGEESRLHESLVKNLRLAVSVGAHIPYWASHVAARGPDMMAIFVSGRIGTGQTDIVKAVDAVLADYCAKGPTQDEIARAKIQLERSWLEGQLTLADRAQMLSSYKAFIGAPDGYWKDLDALLKLKVSDCRRAAHRWLQSRGRVLLQIEPGRTPPVEQEPAATMELPAELPRRAGARPPDPQPVRSPTAPNVRRLELANGLSAWLLADRRLPLVEARLSLRAGRVQESAQQLGLSQACEDLLLKGRGAEDAAAVARAFSALGWSLGTSSEAEWLKLSASGLSRNLTPFLDQLVLTLTGASFPDAEVELWRENALEELISRRSQPSFLSDERMRRELFADHPYARGVAHEEEIKAVRSARLRSFHSERLLPTGAHLVLVGDFDPDLVSADLERIFGAWRGGASAIVPPPLPKPVRGRTVLVDRPGSAQATLAMAHAASGGPIDPDYMAFVLANHVLGGTANSRLFENLRTKRGYTYGAYSSIDLYQRGIVWSAGADCRAEVVEAAMREMRAELGRLREEPISAAALDNARAHLRGLFLMRLSAPDRVAGYLSAVIESGRDPRESIARYEERLSAVTPASALAAVQARLELDRVITVIVGDRSALGGLTVDEVAQSGGPHGA